MYEWRRRDVFKLSSSLIGYMHRHNARMIKCIEITWEHVLLALLRALRNQLQIK